MLDYIDKLPKGRNYDIVFNFSTSKVLTPGIYLTLQGHIVGCLTLGCVTPSLPEIVCLPVFPNKGWYSWAVLTKQTKVVNDGSSFQCNDATYALFTKLKYGSLQNMNKAISPELFYYADNNWEFKCSPHLYSTISEGLENMTTISNAATIYVMWDSAVLPIVTTILETMYTSQVDELHDILKLQDLNIFCSVKTRPLVNFKWIDLTLTPLHTCTTITICEHNRDYITLNYSDNLLGCTKLGVKTEGSEITTVEPLIPLTNFLTLSLTLVDRLKHSLGTTLDNLLSALVETDSVAYTVTMMSIHNKTGLLVTCFEGIAEAVNCL